jgi:hypothetical protein
MPDHKPNLSSDFNPERRKFLIKDVPGAVLAGYAVKTGIAAAAIELFLAGTGLEVFGSEVTHYPGFRGQLKRLKQNGEWQVRVEQEKIRLAAGGAFPEEIYRDSGIEYKLIGSLKRYDWEPTNEVFFKTYKNVIQRLRKAPRCYEIFFEFNKEYKHITYEICYHPYYVDLTYFMCGKTVHQIHVARTFIETSEKSLIGTMYHELVAH